MSSSCGGQPYATRANALERPTPLASRRPSNFRKIGATRFVVAAIAEPAKLDPLFSAAVLKAARTCAPHLRERFGFGLLDGPRWLEYIATFDLDLADLPRLVVIDLEGDKFWDSHLLSLQDVDADAAQLLDFLQLVADGKVPPRFKGWRGFPDRTRRFYAKHSVFCNVLAVAVALLLVLLAQILRAPPDDDLKRPKRE